jgi:hypothetical protein
MKYVLIIFTWALLTGGHKDQPGSVSNAIDTSLKFNSKDQCEVAAAVVKRHTTIGLFDGVVDTACIEVP